MGPDLSVLEFMRAVNEHIERGGTLDAETQQMLALMMHDASSIVDEQPPPPLAMTPDEQQATQLLWMLSGSDPSTFTQYLRTFPDPAFKAIQQNPYRLQQVVTYLQHHAPQPAPESAGGIEKAPLQSSNIYGFRYDPKTGKLLVRFQEGAVYSYEGVPPYVFKVFQEGAVPAKTTGHNKFGAWWTGKSPSAGASFYAMIREGGFPYQRIS
jgi:hypothetical protein